MPATSIAKTVAGDLLGRGAHVLLLLAIGPGDASNPRHGLPERVHLERLPGENGVGLRFLR